MKNNDCWKRYQIRKSILNLGVNKKIEDKLFLSELKNNSEVFNRSQSKIIITQRSLWPN